MMSLREIETKHLINKGLERDRVTNPFFHYMAEKNSFSLKGELTPIGIAFYIAPYVNAMVRSGTSEEKQTLFNSMLKFKAFERVPSTKRGHKLGEEERVVDQAIRAVVNVKSRQTKAQNEGMDFLEDIIIKRNLLKDKVLIILLNPGDIHKNIAGLVANKLMAKYQRHTCILFKTVNENNEVIYQGSARAYSKSNHSNFKKLCEDSGMVEYAEGHPGAFGLGIKAENLMGFVEYTNHILAEDIGEAVYYVDYIYRGNSIDWYSILDIARLNSLWGQDMPEALVAIEGLKITDGMLTLMSADKNPTIKITLFNGAILKFKSSIEEYESLSPGQGYVELDIVGTCSINEWNGSITPQIFIKEYKITDRNAYDF